MGIFKEVTDEQWSELCKRTGFKPTRRRAKYNAYKRQYDKEHNYANTKLNQAIRRGKMTRPLICEACGYMGSLHAHHEDYEKPYDVMWLCPECHRSLHQSKREGMC